MRDYLMLLMAWSALVASAWADSERGTLTLRGETVVHRTLAGDVSYALKEIPGLRVENYEKKTRIFGGREFDVSEVTLKDGNGPKITLVEGMPVIVLHDSAKKTWAMAERQ